MPGRPTRARRRRRFPRASPAPPHIIRFGTPVTWQPTSSFGCCSQKEWQRWQRWQQKVRVVCVCVRVCSSAPAPASSGGGVHTHQLAFVFAPSKVGDNLIHTHTPTTTQQLAPHAHAADADTATLKELVFQPSGRARTTLRERSARTAARAVRGTAIKRATASRAAWWRRRRRGGGDSGLGF